MDGKVQRRHPLETSPAECAKVVEYSGAVINAAPRLNVIAAIAISVT
jgi:hypothetical protein